MDDHRLHPWMLNSDWRENTRPWLLLDLAEWPVEVSLPPLPVPVLAVGSRLHPRAWEADALIEPPISLALMASRINAFPQASATLVQLLRSTDGMSSERALPMESFAFAMLQRSREHTDWLAKRHKTPLVASGSLDVERTDDTLKLTLNRPSALNAIDRAMRDSLHDAFSLAALDSSIRRIVLRGRGRCFSVGADLAEFGSTLDPAEAVRIRRLTLPAYPVTKRHGMLEVHVHGGCIGSGLELAAFADFMAAAPNAWFQLPEIGMGILPGFGGCVSIPARIGRQRAAALMLSGKRVGAELALDWGLIDAIVDDSSIDNGCSDEFSTE